MKPKDLENIANSIQEKLGSEYSALISDDIATIILDNNSMNEELSNRSNQINQLKEDKDKLIMTNNKLFQQVAVGEEEIQPPKVEEKPKFSFKSAFDEKGNFID